MRRICKLLLILVAGVMLTANAEAQVTFGVYYAGGHEVGTTGTPENKVWAEQAMVHTLIPDVITGAPIVMVPGLGLGGYMYYATPDGRKSWAQHFAEAGHPVYVYDIPEYSTSGGFNINVVNDMAGALRTNYETFGDALAPLRDPLPECVEVVGKKGTSLVCPEDNPIPNVAPPPTYAIYHSNAFWSKWGFGEDTDLPFPDVRYPIGQMDQFEKHFPFRYRDGAATEDVAPMTADLDAEQIIPLIGKIGEPAILMVHSWAGGYVAPVLTAAPGLINAVVLLEPVGFGTDPLDIEAFLALLGDRPLIGVYADYVAERGQTGRKDGVVAHINAVLDAGGNAELIDFPALGIYGNTHLFTQDNNNDVLAGYVIDAIADLTTPGAALPAVSITGGTYAAGQTVDVYATVTGPGLYDVYAGFLIDGEKWYCYETNLANTTANAKDQGPLAAEYTPDGNPIQVFDFVVPTLDAAIEVRVFAEVTEPGKIGPLAQDKVDLALIP